jgi:DNA-binding GntR family transcriptional regulator
LVKREEQRGFRVAPVSLSDLAELTKTCCWISELALRASIKNGDADWEEGVVLAAHRLSRVRREGAEGYASFNPEWEERHRAFHLALIGACGSRWLIDFYATLMDRNTRYRYLAFADGSEPRDVEAEHQAIVAAVLARDADRTVAAANAHLRKTTDSVMTRKPNFRTSPGSAELTAGDGQQSCCGRYSHAGPQVADGGSASVSHSSFALQRQSAPLSPSQLSLSTLIELSCFTRLNY